MFEKFKIALERLKKISLYITNLFVCTVGYWLGISLSFSLWKASQLKKKKPDKTCWCNPENTEENYKSQY